MLKRWRTDKVMMMKMTMAMMMRRWKRVSKKLSKYLRHWICRSCILYYLVLVDEPKGQPSVAPGGHAVCQATIWHFKRLPCLILLYYGAGNN